MSKDVFSPRRRTKFLGRTIHNILGHATFDHKVLEDKVRGIARDCLGDADAALLEEEPGCKIFVCASMFNTETQRLRSYHSPAEESSSCSIWEAARATSAAPTFFDPITFSNGCTFRDGALRDNNPIFELIDEIRTEFPAREVSCVVSIGTGVPTSITVRNGLASVAKACAKITTDTEKVARRFERIYCSPDAKYRGKYFRYNIPRGVGDVRLDEWEKADIMMSNAMSYLREAAEALNACASLLGRGQIGLGEVTTGFEQQGDSKKGVTTKPRPLLATASGSSADPRRTYEDHRQRLGLELRRQPSSVSGCQLPPSQSRHQGAGPENEAATNMAVLSLAVNNTPPREIHFDDFYQLDRIGKQPVPNFAVRPELDQIKTVFSGDPRNGDVKVLSLVGLGGTGKTQLMLQHAYSERRQYGVVLWIDATTEDAVASTYKVAASLLGLVPPPFERVVSTSSSVDRYSPGLEANVAAVKRELQRRSRPWLMLFDGADGLATIQKLRNYIPSAPNGHVLISSRRKQARHIGRHFLKVEGLPIDSARSLLLYQACIKDPSDSDVHCAETIVQSLECIALAVELAGSYIETLGCLESYLELYESHKEELLRRSIGNCSALASDYKMSVLTAWQVSIAAIPKKTTNLLYLLCLLDRTNLSKDMFKRACQDKTIWNVMGEIDRLTPVTSGVPRWLLDLFCDENGQWSEFQYHEAVSDLSSFFFVEKEVLTGPWQHHSGTVDAEFMTSDGEILELLKVPQPVHDVGKLYPDEMQQEELCHDAFSVVVHSFWNNVPTEILPGSSGVVMYVGQGGMAATSTALSRHLEEAYGHIHGFRHVVHSHTESLCYDSQIPQWKRAEAIIFATTIWSSTFRYHERTVRQGRAMGKRIQGDKTYWRIIPWDTIFEITDTLLEPPSSPGTWRPMPKARQGSSSKTRNPAIWQGRPRTRQGSPSQTRSPAILPSPGLHYPEDAFQNVYIDFERKWARRQSYYWERICRSNISSQAQFSESIYRIMAMAEAELSRGIASYEVIRQRMTAWCAKSGPSAQRSFANGVLGVVFEVL
ncbi:hypothetical protein Hte_006505 [Hypoxylon texense]